MSRYGVILAGGRGTRFWPRSRRKNAKQVLRFLGERTMIQQTVDRLRPVLAPDNLWVITNADLVEEITHQLPEVPRRQIVAEPAGRSTAPAIGLAASILHASDPDAVMGVFPADHYISKPKVYARLLTPAFRAAEGGALVVLGIAPRWAETGYGYIEFPKGDSPAKPVAVPIAGFREKPDAKTASRFLRAGRFYWNAGMFFWRCDTFLEEFRRCLPKTATLIAGLPPFESPRFGEEFERVYPLCQDISVDKGILEKSERVQGIRAPDFGWSDMGSWNAVHELASLDKGGNAINGDALLIESEGNYVEAAGKLVALVGVRDLVVIDTPDALLIVPRDQAQRVGEAVKQLEKLGRDELL